jgi:hypothetical protein
MMEGKKTIDIMVEVSLFLEHVFGVKDIDTQLCCAHMSFTTQHAIVKGEKHDFRIAYSC